MFIILENNIDIEQYIRKFKKVKENVTLAIKDIAYLSVEEANKFRDRLGVEFINILENSEDLDINNLKYCYSVSDYIKIRKNLDEIVSNVSKHTEDLNKFNELYNYFKSNIKYDEDAKDLKCVFLDKESSYNFFAIAINSCLKLLGFDSKIIGGEINSEDGFLWNQVCINEEWYNFDLAEEKKAKADKKVLQYVFKGNLLSDEQFYKNHVPLFGEPEICETELQEMKKEIKRELKENSKKISLFSRIINKIKSIFKFNKTKSLPAPDDDSEE